MRKIIYLCLSVLFILSLSACVGNENGSSTDTKNNASPTASGDGTEDPIIAESDNAVSDKEKQAILDALSSQLDDALKGTADLEDLDDSDLDEGNIE